MDMVISSSSGSLSDSGSDPVDSSCFRSFLTRSFSSSSLNSSSCCSYLQRLRKARKAQLFIVEVLIAVSIIVLLLASLSDLTTTVDRPEDNSLYETGFSVLETLDNSGFLQDYLTTLSTGSSSEISAMKTQMHSAITSLLEPNVFYNLRVYSYSGGSWSEMTTAALNTGISPSSSASIAVVEYSLPGYGSTVSLTSIQLTLWYEGL